MKYLTAFLLLGALCISGAAQDEAATVTELGHRSCRVREFAMKRLRDNLTPEAVRLLEKAQSCDDPEVARRAELLLRPHYEKAAQQAVANVKAHCGGKLPWIDQLPEDYPERAAVLARHLTQARQTCFEGAPEWREFRLATEYHLLELARDRQPVEQLVNAMKQREIVWIQAHGRSYTPPLVATWK
jgi:hypothetical protein